MIRPDTKSSYCYHLCYHKLDYFPITSHPGNLPLITIFQLLMNNMCFLTFYSYILCCVKLFLSLEVTKTENNGFLFMAEMYWPLQNTDIWHSLRKGSIKISLQKISLYHHHSTFLLYLFIISHRLCISITIHVPLNEVLLYRATVIEN